MNFEVNLWFKFVGGSGFPISPGAATALAYSDEDGILHFMHHSTVSYPYFTIPAHAVLDIQIEGSILSRGGGFAGGGFGLAGIATGMLAAGALNAMTRHSEIQTLIRIVASEGEVILFTNVYTPQTLRIVLSPLYTGIQKWARIEAAALSDERDCPFCAERIKRAAILCRFCGRDVAPDDARVLPVAETLSHEWLCSACSQSNYIELDHCGYCGHARGGNET
jgi:hypothetical protein